MAMGHTFLNFQQTWNLCGDAADGNGTNFYYPAVYSRFAESFYRKKVYNLTHRDDAMRNVNINNLLKPGINIKQASIEY